MPRYCSVKVCRNRGGTASGQDKKRISFYPFPLRDQSRLQRWTENMKREEWAPSRHQYLCSEHFTEDCFDIRWGIRYLKGTAIPTIFPSAEDGGEKCTASKRSPKVNPTGLNSPLIKKPLTSSGACEQSKTTDIAAENTEIFEPPLVPETSITCHSNPPEVQTSSCEISSSGGMPTAPCLPLTRCVGPHSDDHTDSAVKVLCCEADLDLTAHQAALGQAFSSVPLEMVKDVPAGCVLEERGSDAGVHINVYEHSYCRRDMDKNQLWGKILSLHAKVLELDRREESTVAKIRALETEISFLKRDSTVFKEKQKVLEDYMLSMF